MSQCTDCQASATPPPNRRENISSLNKSFNDVVYIDHFHMEDVILFHLMDVASRYSAVHVVTSTATKLSTHLSSIGYPSFGHQMQWLPMVPFIMKHLNHFYQKTTSNYCLCLQSDVEKHDRTSSWRDSLYLCSTLLLEHHWKRCDAWYTIR